MKNLQHFHSPTAPKTLNSKIYPTYRRRRRRELSIYTFIIIMYSTNILHIKNTVFCNEAPKFSYFEKRTVHRERFRLGKMDDESFFAAFIQGIEFKAFASNSNEMYNNKTKCIEFHISHNKNITRSYPLTQLNPFLCCWFERQRR